MNDHMFRLSVMAVAIAFAVFFAVTIVPPLIANPDIVGAFAAGFVNPYSTGYSVDVICCWNILALWVWYEWRNHSIKGGWICLLLGLVPGVAVGFGVYLVMRHKQLEARAQSV